VLALQKSINGFDGQLAYFTRYNNLQFTPDIIGDMLLNGIASNVTRTSYTNRLQGDGSYNVNRANIVRAGFVVSGEKEAVNNFSIVEPCSIRNGSDGPPERIRDETSKVGWLMGVYGQDEWKITDELTMNAGLCSDLMIQNVDANQLSPRLSFTYKPFESTTWHAGYARFFRPPVALEAAPANIGLFRNTTGAPFQFLDDPVLPERSHYFDAGVSQEIPMGCGYPGIAHVHRASRGGARLRYSRDRARRLLQDRERPDRQWKFRPSAGLEQKPRSAMGFPIGPMVWGVRWILRLFCGLRPPLRYGNAIAMGLDCPFGRHHRSSQRNLVRGRHRRLQNRVTVRLFLRALSDMRS
jgi:hypothetical protein